jgi:hypothetical protein
MIEKKIRYDINIEKPSKTKPVEQGGVLNFLGKQKTVNAPVKWRSSKDHPIAHLSYITKDEQKILIDLNLYGSLKGKPNRGPFGLPSLQGSGGGSGGDGGGDGGSSGGDSGPGDSGPGGSDDGTGHGGPGPGDSGPGGSDDGTGHGGPGPGPGDTGSVGPSNEGFGIGPDAATDAAQSAAQSISADNISTQAQADQEDAATAAAANAATSGVASLARQAIQAYMTYSPVGMLSRAVSNVVGNISRGVRGPSDDTQEQSSVQTSAPASSNVGGIDTINQFAPLYNTSTGDNTADALRIRLNNLIQAQQPVIRGIPTVSPYSNYTLLDLTKRGLI